MKLYLLLVLFILPTFGYTQPPILELTDEIASAEISMDLMPLVEILQDTSGDLTIEELESGAHDDKFNIRTEHTNDQRFTQSTYWLRLQLTNQSTIKDWYLGIDGGLARHVKIYQREGDTTSHFKPLPIEPHSRGFKYHFPLPLNQNLPHLLYVQIQDKHTPLFLNLTLYTAPQLLTKVKDEFPLYSFLIGGLLMLVLYNFIYYLHMHDKGFLSLAIFIFAVTIEISNHEGLLGYFPFFSKNLYWINSTFAFVIMASGFSFAISLLGIRENLAHWLIWFRAGFWVSCGLGVVGLFIPYAVIMAALIGLVGIILVSIIIVLLYRQGKPLPISLLLSIIIFIVASTPTLLRGTGLIETPSITMHNLLLGLLFSLVLLSLTQAEKIKLKSQKADRIATSNKAKDEFLTTMSHELRTPMTAVVNAGYLLKQTPLSETQNNYVSQLNTSSKHMLSLINDVLDLARSNTQKLLIENIPFELDHVLKQVKQLLAEQANKKHLEFVIENHFQHYKKHLLGDPTRLQQILLNLLSNAIKFTPQGKIKLVITPQTVTENHVSLFFEVQDNGIGISPEQQQTLFQPFSQADSSTSRTYGGSGLGLAISQKLIQLMGGELNVKSQTNQGSCFYFTLTVPLHDTQPTEQKEQNARFSETPRSISLSDIHILLVDDDDLNRFYGSTILETFGIRVKSANSGEQAIRYIEEHRFDLVFMDVSMPEMDGYETTQHIRTDKRFKDLPIIALTAHAIADERGRCLTSGMNDYLTKPFEPDQLKMMIQRWTGKSQQLPLQK